MKCNVHYLDVQAET